MPSANLPLAAPDVVHTEGVWDRGRPEPRGEGRPQRGADGNKLTGDGLLSPRQVWFDVNILIWSDRPGAQGVHPQARGAADGPGRGSAAGAGRSSRTAVLLRRGVPRGTRSDAYEEQAPCRSDRPAPRQIRGQVRLQRHALAVHAAAHQDDHLQMRMFTSNHTCRGGQQPSTVNYFPAPRCARPSPRVLPASLDPTNPFRVHNIRGRLGAS